MRCNDPMNARAFSASADSVRRALAASGPPSSRSVAITSSARNWVTMSCSATAWSAPRHPSASLYALSACSAASPACVSW